MYRAISRNAHLPFPHDLKQKHVQFLYLHWATYNSFSSLYTERKVPKRNGESRLLEVPHPILKMAQRQLMETLDKRANYNDACHGFRRERSIKTNALPHVGKEIVLNFDLKDFFPSITFYRVMSMFEFLGFHSDSLLAHLVTKADHLPQGAPTSPVIANIICSNLDQKLTKLAVDVGADYTRYADDITISGNSELPKLIHNIRHIITSQGFTVNEKKTRIQRAGRRQEVTGLTVNEKVSVPRHIRKKLRAATNKRSHGEQPTWNGTSISDKALKGHIDYITSIHSDLKKSYQSQLTLRR